MSDFQIPAGVELLHGSLYKVPFEMLLLPQAEEQSAEYHFHNPRKLTKAGEKDAYDKDKNQEMRHSIKERTLFTPFISRWVKTKDGHRPQLVGGERRYRAVDFLRHKKELVRNPSATGLEYEYLPADQVYSSVLVQVYHVKDDIEALLLSFEENRHRINLNEGHDIAQLVELRKCNVTDPRICEVLNKQSGWLRDSDKLITGLDKECLEFLINGDINREAAAELLKIEDIKARIRVAKKSILSAHEAASAKINKIKKQLSSIDEKEDIAEGDVVVAEFAKDEEAKEIAEQKISYINERRQKLKDKIGKVRRVGKTRDVIAAAKQFKVIGSNSDGGTITKKCLRPIKIRKLYVEPLKELLESEESDLPEVALKLAVRLIEGILDGDTDPMKIIKKVAK